MKRIKQVQTTPKGIEWLVVISLKCECDKGKKHSHYLGIFQGQYFLKCIFCSSIWEVENDS